MLTTPKAAEHSISILGAGSWGTALANLIAQNGHHVTLWGHTTAHIDTLLKTRRNDRYLPDIHLSEKIHFTADLASAVKNSAIVLLVVPSHAFRAVLIAVRPYLKRGAKIAWGTKGLDKEKGQLLHSIVWETLSEETLVAVLSGPSFAREVAAHKPTAVTVASNHNAFAQELAQILHNPSFRVYTSDDIIGVQLGGAVKNVLAIATGVADGMALGANARAALVTRGLAEMMRLGLALGGKQETLMGLSGVGDLILTCTDNQSRNRRLGLGIGQGKSIATVLDQIDQEVEGITTARIVYQLAKAHGIDMPITEQTYHVLYEAMPPSEAVHNLLIREQKPEKIG